MAGGILMVAELKGTEIAPITKQVVGTARKLADEKGLSVSAVAIGKDIGGAADSLIKLGADTVYVCDSPDIENFIDESYAKIIADVAEQDSPKVILGGASFFGKELFPRLAATINSGLAPDITALDWDGDNILATRPTYGGKAILKVTPSGSGPQMATLRSKAFADAGFDDGRSGNIEQFAYDSGKHGARSKVLESVSEGGQTISLTDADIIVSGGRGIRESDNFKLINELADALGAAVGASRATVDAGWIPYSHQVGQTGKTVNPKLYVACGISGAIQHLVGMQSSKVIVAINRDEEAPIFKVATYGIVGDLFEFVPALTEKLKSMG
ncbi:MAG: electron transfer flavoprotein subunit alpha/FixB family protein [candidate division Zixibacteria bacterium]|nr:electron transfer flavoprotein subunit alpha/FixB family protein [candidate division Zixibacteria bacterium]